MGARFAVGSSSREQARVQHEHPAHGQHLALAAAELPGAAAEHAAEPGKDGQHPLDPLRHLRPTQQIATHLKVLPDGERTEHVIHLGHVADGGPGYVLGR
jgi:hypothetical protein